MFKSKSGILNMNLKRHLQALQQVSSFCFFLLADLVMSFTTLAATFDQYKCVWKTERAAASISPQSSWAAWRASRGARASATGAQRASRHTSSGSSPIPATGAARWMPTEIFWGLALFFLATTLTSPLPEPGLQPHLCLFRCSVVAIAQGKYPTDCNNPTLFMATSQSLSVMLIK